MRQPVVTALSLWEWREVLGISPWEFAQLGAGYDTHQDKHCNHVFYQHQWQRDFLSRDEIAFAIQESEALLAQELGYWPGPRYQLAERQTYTRPWVNAWRGNAVTPRGEPKAVRLSYGHFQAAGIIARSLLDDDAGVTYSARYTGDPLDELATISVTASVIGDISDPHEIAVYFTAADRFSETISETWRIRPLTVVIAGNTATITGHKAQFVKPEQEEGTKPDNLDATVAGNFVTEVEVYRTYTDSTSTDSNPNQGQAIWLVPPGCSDDCEVKTGPLCLNIHDDQLGWVKVDPAQTWPYNYEPDYVEINYLAGFPRTNGRMDPLHARMVAYLACSMLTRTQCGCERSTRIVEHWAELPSKQQERERPLVVDEIMLPWGARRGARYAWNQVDRLTLVRGGHQ